mmetsp:Transcript_119244/g.187071  ORF Transcript_119244/g.187071 Transcript_119244/m.187071 type:complete len:175 (+) Transcript_119244:40-564(+)
MPRTWSEVLQQQPREARSPAGQRKGLSKSQSFSGMSTQQAPVDNAFGHYGPDLIWSRGVGGGYHEPKGKPHRELDFQRWQEKWISPSHGVPTRHLNDTVEMEVPRLPLPLTRSDSEAPSRFVPGPSLESFSSSGAAAYGIGTHKVATYPNPTNWKRNTSLLARMPGQVGRLRTQ